MELFILQHPVSTKQQLTIVHTGKYLILFYFKSLTEFFTMVEPQISVNVCF